MFVQVQFVGEEAVDEGGVRKEFFLLLIKEVLDPKYGMFKAYTDSRLLWFNPQVGTPQAVCLSFMHKSLTQASVGT